MLRLLADENFNNDVVRGCLRRHPELDLVRVQDVGLYQADDPTVLEWAAQDNRILLTHDQATIPDYAYDRVARGLVMPGVFLIHTHLPVGQAIAAILLPALASAMDEWRDQVAYLPL